MPFLLPQVAVVMAHPAFPTIRAAQEEVVAKFWG